MADIVDVQQALCAAIAQAIYPNGTAADSAAGVPVLIYPGWPSQANLDGDLLAGKTHVSVFPRAEERNTTRYPETEQVLRDPAPTITAAIVGQTVALGGVVSTPQNVGLLVNSEAYVYAVQPGDSLVAVATGLATLLQVDLPETVNNGTVIVLPDGAVIKAARVGANGRVGREIRRQERRIQVTVWSDTPDNRDAVSRIVDVALSVIRFLALPDGYGARVVYVSSPVSDAAQKAKLYRRDFIYAVEYPTTIVEDAPAVIVEQINIAGGNDPVNSPVIATTYL